jgi:hypothetical protein
VTAPSTVQKNIFIGNAYLVRQQLRYYDAISDSFLPWGGPAKVSFCTKVTDPVTGVVTYTPIAGMGPFNLNQGMSGTFYYEVPTSVVGLLNTVSYLNGFVYQVVTGGNSGELTDIQPLLVCPSRYAS